MKRYKLAGAAILVAMAAAFPVASQQQNPLGDILIAHSSGFISLDYGEDVLPLTGDAEALQYTNAFYSTLKQEIFRANFECVNVEVQIIKAPRIHYLSDEVKNTIDSLKRPDGSYSDYLVVSGLMRKHAGRLSTASRPQFSVRHFTAPEGKESWQAEDSIRTTFPDREGYFAGRCNSMISAMLPGERIDDRFTEAFSNDLCRSLTTLKACYADLDRLDESLAKDRRSGLLLDGTGEMTRQQAVNATVN